MRPDERHSILTLTTIGVALMAAASCRSLVAAGLSNGGLLLAVRSAKCGAAPCTSEGRGVAYPPSREAAERGRVRLSVRALEVAAALQPAAAGHGEHLVELRFVLDEVAEATALFEGAASRGRHRQALLVKGRALYHLLRSRSAERHQDLAGARDDALRGLALAAYGLGDRNEAREVSRVGRLTSLLARAAPGSPRDPADALDAVRSSACAADWTEAAMWARQLLARQTPDVRAREFAARVSAFRARQDLDEAGERQWLQQTGTGAFDQWTLGDPYLWLGRELEAIGLDRCSPGAVALYRWYSGEQPGSAQGLYLEAGVRYWRGEFTRAREIARAGVERDPQHTGCHVIRALASEAVGELVASRDSYLLALALDPALAEVWIRLGGVEHRLHRDGEAERAYERALALRPDDAQIGVSSAFFFLELGRHRRACELFRRVASRQPENALAARGLADCQRRGLE